MVESQTGCYELISEAADPYQGIFLPTPHASSVWGTQVQHGGPVAGLLTRAMDRLAPNPGFRISRISVDIMGAVPMAPVAITAWLERPGSRVQLLVSEMRDASAGSQGRLLARASAWRLATRETNSTAHSSDSSIMPRDASATHLDWPEAWRIGFAASLEAKLMSEVGVRGQPTVAWLRMTEPLVQGEEMSYLESAVTISDVANGIGARLNPVDWTFLNTDLVLHLYDEPRGWWLGISAETSIGMDGIGMSAASLHSEQGVLGRLAQNILIQPR